MQPLAPSAQPCRSTTPHQCLSPGWCLPPRQIYDVGGDCQPCNNRQRRRGVAMQAPGGLVTAVPEISPSSVDLTPFVPRVVVDWLRADPDAKHRRLEGTLAFVDISGFTALNERLAQKGKLGAEEVTDVMNRTFERLLDVAYAAGGGLLKFGGDALLLFFTGEDHAARACDASFGMRQALDDLGEPQTSVGPVTLKMHVGIHADTYDFFLVGESHRELLLTGPGVTRTVEMESGAEAGEILVSDETAAALPEDVLGEAKAGGRLLEGQAGAGRGGGSRAVAVAGGDRSRRLRARADPPCGRGRPGRVGAPSGLGRVRALRRRRPAAGRGGGRAGRRGARS